MLLRRGKYVLLLPVSLSAIYQLYDAAGRKEGRKAAPSSDRPGNVAIRYGPQLEFLRHDSNLDVLLSIPVIPIVEIINRKTCQTDQD